MTTPVVKRVRGVLSCGLTPQKRALTLCLGGAFGIIPLPWGAALVCIVLAYSFRLNHVALQSVNYLLWPVQLALLIPFFKMGVWLFPWGPTVELKVLSALIQSPGFSSVHILGWIMLKALAAWTVTVLPAALCIYGVLRVSVFKEHTH